MLRCAGAKATSRRFHFHDLELGEKALTGGNRRLLAKELRIWKIVTLSLSVDPTLASQLLALLLATQWVAAVYIQVIVGLPSVGVRGEDPFILVAG